MPLLALCYVRGRGAGAYCCPPPGAQGQDDAERPAPPLRVDADADDYGGGCYEELLLLPVSTPPRVPRGLARGEEDDAYGADDDGLKLTTRGAPGLREDADEAEEQLVSPAPVPAAPGGVGSAKSWISTAIASVYERLSRTFSVLP